MNGDTQRKAMTFYLHAAKFSGVPVSKNFKVITGFTRRPRRGNGAAETTLAADTTPPAATDPKGRYIEMLMEKARNSEGELDEALLNRIERLLGYEALAE